MQSKSFMVKMQMLPLKYLNFGLKMSIWHFSSIIILTHMKVSVKLFLISHMKILWQKTWNVMMAGLMLVFLYILMMSWHLKNVKSVDHQTVMTRVLLHTTLSYLVNRFVTVLNQLKRQLHPCLLKPLQNLLLHHHQQLVQAQAFNQQIAMNCMVSLKRILSTK